MTDEEKIELLGLLLDGDDPVVVVGFIGPGAGIMHLGMTTPQHQFIHKPAAPRAAVLVAGYLGLDLEKGAPT